MTAAIDVLILDVNDVLYRYDTRRRIELLADLTATTPDAVHLAMFESGVENRSDSGDLTPDGYLAAIGDRLARPVDRSEWVRSLAGALTPMRESIDVVRRLHGRVAMVGLTNNGLIVKEESRRIFPVLSDLGIDLYVSAEFGARKPVVPVYLGLCRRLDVEPGRAAFVDDRADNAEGAAAAGLRGHHFTTVDSLRSFLAELGLPV